MYYQLGSRQYFWISLCRTRFGGDNYWRKRTHWPVYYLYCFLFQCVFVHHAPALQLDGAYSYYRAWLWAVPLSSQPVIGNAFIGYLIPGRRVAKLMSKSWPTWTRSYALSRPYTRTSASSSARDSQKILENVIHKHVCWKCVRRGKSSSSTLRYILSLPIRCISGIPLMLGRR